jgi:hypothetical protein
MKKVYINQPRYLGDVIFVMAIAQKYANEGYEVIFPVEDSYLKNASIEKNFPEITFTAQSAIQGFKNKNYLVENHKNDGLVINFYATSKYKDHMGKKYLLLDLPVKQWRELKIQRDLDAEKKLIEKLSIASNDKFNLINEYYSNKKTINMHPEIKNSYKNIYLEKVDGFNLFDWMGVIERAESIHTVHTSIQYIIDVMEGITTDIHIYPRVEIYEPHSYYDYLFSKKYIYHSHPKNIKYQLKFNLRKLKRNLVYMFHAFNR